MRDNTTNIPNNRFGIRKITGGIFETEANLLKITSLIIINILKFT